MKKITLKLVIILVILTLLLPGCASRENLIEGRVLENKSVITSRGIEYRAKIALADRLGGEKWVWVTIPERDAKVLPPGSRLIVNLNEDGYRIVTEGY